MDPQVHERLGLADAGEHADRLVQHLDEVVNKTIRVFPGVRETETFMYLRVHKESYTWGFPSQ